ncbi:MAG: precorrin-2 C(20)-methyltransferase [Chromatiales bacterium]|nr:precorrin-2 C(20)-methyltransferase [Chromatiales bacterium]
MDRIGTTEQGMSSYGKLYGVSLGPGDPELMTRKAWKLLNGSTHWAYPIKRKGSDSYALDILHRAGLKLPERLTPLVFPMTHDHEKLAAYWLRAAQTVLEFIHRGEDVLFLVEGDASTYSTFGHLARTLTSLDDRIPVEIVAGVSSFNAAAADLQLPLADTDDTLAIIPAGYGVKMLDRLLVDFDTLVLLKVKPVLESVLDLLEQKGLLASSAFIEKAGTPDERVVHNLTELRGTQVNYLSLLLVRNHHRVRGEMIRGCRKKSVA